MREAIVNFDHVGVAYGDATSLFQGVNIQLDPGGFFFLTGESGSGKSTFLRLLYLDLMPTWGVLNVLGIPTQGLSWAKRMRLRQQIGIIFQEFKILPHLTVVENVALALRVRGLDEARSTEQAKDLLDWVGVSATRDPQLLSGGEKQRVAVARAVITRPQLLLADEPTGNVDDKSAARLMYLFSELHKIGTTVLVATHNMELTTRWPYPRLHLENQSVTFISPGHSGDALKSGEAL